MRLIQKGFILVGVPLLVASAICGSMFWLILQTDNERAAEAMHRERADHACRSLLVATDLLLCMQQVIASHDPRLTASSMHPGAEHRMQIGAAELKSRLKADIGELRSLRQEVESHEKPALSDQSVLGLQAQVNSLIDDTGTLAQSFKNMALSFDGLNSFDDARRRLAKRSYEIATAANGIVDKSLRFQQTSYQHQQAVFGVEVTVLIAGVLASIAGGLLMARWFTTSIASRLQTVTDNTLRMERGELLNPQLAGDEEIAELDSAFHGMAEALRAAMANERALFAAASDVMCVLDGQLRVTAANAACHAILGYKPEDIIGREIWQFVPSSSQNSSRLQFDSVKSGHPAAVFENLFLHADGRELDLWWSIYWSELDQALYAVAHDITERRELERRKEEFLAMVSHDLRAPLTSIRATFTLLEVGVFGKLAATIEQKITAVNGSVSRLLALVNDLLDMEKLEAGKLDLRKEEADVGELVRQAVTEVQPLAVRAKVNIRTEVTCGSFTLDNDRTMQVMINLLSNAIKYSPPESNVTVKAACENGNLKVQVQDEGPGIPEAKQALIFERFKQARAEDARTGTGLGLPICKLIVEEHGGAIGVTSQPDAGSTFWFTLPSSAASIAASDTARPDDRQLSTTVPPPAVQAPNDDRGKSGNPLSNLRLFHKGLVLVAVPVLFELVFAGSLYPLLDQTFRAKQQELHQRMIVNTVNATLLSFFAMGFAMSLRPLTASWQAFHENSVQGIDSAKRLNQLAASDPQYAAVMHEFQPSLEIINSVISTAHKAVLNFGITDIGMFAAYNGRDELLRTAQEARPVIAQLIQRAAPAADAVTAKVERLREQQGVLLLGGFAASLILSGASAFFFSFGIARRLQAVQGTVSRIERGEPLGPALAGQDEIAYLDRFLHRMAQSLEETRRKDRAVFDNAQDAICTVTGNGIILRANPAFDRMWGCMPGGAKGASLFEFTNEEAANSFRSVAEDNEPRQIEGKIFTTGGADLDVLWSLSWSPEEHAVVCIAHDITKRKELERLKHEFLAMVSHDMRTPLTSIMGETMMLSQGVFGNLPADALPLLSAVEASCDRLLSLIRDLLDLDKLEAGQMPMLISSVPAERILQRTADTLAGLATDKNIGVKLELAELPPVKGDEERLVQVGTNLLSNAIKFSEPGSTVILSARELPGFVEFRVRDNGRGIPANQLANVFERFRQVRAEDGKRGAGTGLGLSICKQIVEQLGGEIGVTSEVGAGTTFFFRIPSDPILVVHEHDEMANAQNRMR